MRTSHKTDWVPKELAAYRAIKSRLLSDGADEESAARVARRMVERYSSEQRRAPSRAREASR